ncbi:MAG: hypothetical protein IJ174_04930, partial [Clostridia bacterium]|nr:hypothetical protein [Clostridia bacterium]
MNKDARWLPMDLTLSDGNHIRSLYVRGGAWQLYTTAEDGQALAVDDALYTRWLSLEWVEEGLFEDVSTEEGTVHVLCARAGSLISSLRYGPYPHQRSQALDFVKALKRSVERMGSLALDDALYVERFSLILSTSDASAGGATVNLAAGRFLTGGMEVPLSAAELVLQYAPYLNESDVNGMLDRLGLSKDEGAAGTLTAPKQAAAAP